MTASGKKQSKGARLKWLHKYFGIFTSVALLYISVTGILLNHPRIIAGADWPGRLLPEDMRIKNWGRGAVFAVIPFDSASYLLGGKAGIFRAGREGAFVEKFGSGLPENIYDGTVFCLFREDSTNTVYAGLRSGLYAMRKGIQIWKKDKIVHSEVRSIFTVNGITHVFTVDGSWRKSGAGFKRIASFKREGSEHKRIPLVQYVFDLHTGRVFGFAGKLFMDAGGIFLFLLSLSGITIFLFPKSGRRFFSWIRSSLKWLRRFHNTHFKWWKILLMLPLLILPLTGFFMRPPFIVLLVHGHIPAVLHVNPPKEGTWGGRLVMAVHDASRHTILVCAEDSIYEGPDDFSAPFRKVRKSYPVHPMGPTAFIPQKDGRCLIGSFSGLMYWNRNTDTFSDYYTGEEVSGLALKQRGPYQVNGMIEFEGKQIVIDYRKGLSDLRTGQKFLPMPERYRTMSTFSLWHFLFEVHNGRIYKSIFPRIYIFHNPLAALLTIFLIITGFLYLIRKGILFKGNKKQK